MATNRFRDPSVPRSEVSGITAWLSVTETQTFTLIDPSIALRRDLHRVQYSAFCQQWIAVAMAAIVGKE